MCLIGNGSSSSMPSRVVAIHRNNCCREILLWTTFHCTTIAFGSETFSLAQLSISICLLSHFLVIGRTTAQYISTFSLIVYLHFRVLFSSWRLWCDALHKRAHTHTELECNSTKLQVCIPNVVAENARVQSEKANCHRSLQRLTKNNNNNSCNSVTRKLCHFFCTKTQFSNYHMNVSARCMCVCV